MTPLIAIISECDSDNLGDQAIARSLSNILDPMYHISKVSFGKVPINIAGEKVSCPNFFKSTLRSIIRKTPGKTKARVRWHIFGEKQKFSDHFRASIQESDLVIVGGGQLIKNNTALFCEKLSLVSAISSDCAKPMMIIGVGVDKKMNLETWRIARRAISRANVIILRDLVSRDRICTGLNFDRDYPVLPDLAFALKNSATDRKRSDRGTSLAINVMDLEAMLRPLGVIETPVGDNFIASLCNIIKLSHDGGSTISLFTSGSTDDLYAANDIKSKISARTGVEVPVFHPSTLDDLLAFLIDVDSVIATRMHAGILAYISGCNPLCLNWDDKVAGVWSAISQSERVIQMEDIVREESGALLLGKLKKLAPASRNSLDKLAEEVRDGVLAPIGKILTHNQTTRTLKE